LAGGKLGLIGRILAFSGLSNSRRKTAKCGGKIGFDFITLPWGNAWQANAIEDCRVNN